jgi:hypothetical protein
MFFMELAMRFLGAIVLMSLLSACTTQPVSPVVSAAPQPKDSIVCNFTSAAAGYAGFCDVTCSVNALAVNFDGLEPKRACTGPVRTVQADLSRTGVANRWLGKMQGVQPEDPTRFEVVPNAIGKGSVGRTPFGWFEISHMREADGKLKIEMNADRQVRPTRSDIAILERARQLLPNETVWNKNDNRQCPPAQNKISLFCALNQATVEISGGVHYRQPAAQAVREVLNTVDSRRIKTHRIMDFNNHPDTTLGEIHAILDTAKTRVARDLR